MNWTSIKTPKDIVLDGIVAECEYRDKTLAAVTFTDQAGHQLRMVLENYSVRVLIPAKPETKTVHAVVGVVPMLNTPVREEFEDAYSASSRLIKLSHQGVIDDDAKVVIEEVEVPF